MKRALGVLTVIALLTVSTGSTGVALFAGSTGFAGPAAQLGMESLPFTGTALESSGSAVGLLGLLGLLLLYLRRKTLGMTWELATLIGK